MLFSVRDPSARRMAREELVADLRRLKDGGEMGRAFETDVYVTNTCNLRCDYCYFYFEDYFNAPTHHERANRTLDQLKLLIDKIAGRTYCLVVLGGEPFSRPDIEMFLRYVKNSDIYSTRVTTNGLLLKRRIESLPFVDTLTVSFDAMRVRQYPKQMARLLEDLADLRSQLGNNLPVVIPSWTTAPDDDFEADVRPLIDFSREHGFVVKFLPLKVNQHADWAKEKEIVLQALEYAGPEAITNNIEHTRRLSDQFGAQNCLVRGNQFYVDFDGNFLYPCDEYAHNEVGSLFDSSIDELLAIGMKKYGSFPVNESVCSHCPSGCHSDNSFILRNPGRQLDWLS